MARKKFKNRDAKRSAAGDRPATRTAPEGPKAKPRPVELPPETEIIYGKHSVKAVTLKRPRDIHHILIAGKPDYHQDLIALAEKNQVDVTLLPWPDFLATGRFSEQDKHQGVLAITHERQIYLDGELHRLAEAKCVLVLDQVSNPQNLATIIRSAAFFHADALLFMKNRAATPTAEVVRFAVGGAEMIEMYQITNVARALDELKEMGFAVLGLDERGEKTLAQHALDGQVAFVIGAEGEGLRKKTKDYCSDLVRIPGGAEGLESLNAAVATTLALYEYARLSDD